jgi:branched-chain amino acid transport system ATP-binding protein
VTGPYLAMMTIAFGFIVEHGTIEWRQLTGGQNGLMGIPQPALGALMTGERAMAAIGVAIAGISLLLYDILFRGSWGRAMIAVRDSETAASGIGLEPVVVKTLAFALSAAFTGIAGGCFAALLAFIAPSAFPFSQSILFLLAVVVGGAGWTLGPVVGAIVTVVLPELISSLAEYRLLIFGGLLLAVLWIAPDGVIGGLMRRFKSAKPRLGHATAIDIRSFLDRGDGGAGLEVSGLTISFGGIKAATGVALTARPGQVTGLIGPNGAGKTTVLNMISGYYPPDTGSICLGTKQLAGSTASAVTRAGIARTYQTTQLFGSLSVFDNVLLGLRTGRLGNPFGRLAGESDLAAADGLLALVGYRGDLDASASSLPHVDRRLVEIARAVATRPGVLLLDEPAAGLSAAEKEHLKTVLRKLAGAGLAVMLVEHDMTLVMGLCDHIVVLDAGRPIAAGAPSEIRNDPRVRAAYLGSGDVQPPARQRPLEPDGEVILAARAIEASYGAVPVLHGVTLEVRQGELVALLGSNGAGKSTTMRAVSGLLRPVGGEIVLRGSNITAQAPHRIAAAGLALVPEGRQVFPELSVRDNLELGAYSRGAVVISGDVEQLLTRFPRLRERLDQRAGLLSGGEAQMLAVARGLMSKPRILLLDEPSLGLAPAVIEELYQVLAELRDAGVTLLLVDQMAAMALTIADRGYVIASGRIIHAGSAAELTSDPALDAAYLGRTTTHS